MRRSSGGSRISGRRFPDSLCRGEAQLASAGRAEVSAVGQVAVVRATGGSWVVQVAPKGVGGEGSRAAAARLIHRRYEFS